MLGICENFLFAEHAPEVEAMTPVWRSSLSDLEVALKVVMIGLFWIRAIRTARAAARNTARTLVGLLCLYRVVAAPLQAVVGTVSSC